MRGKHAENVSEDTDEGGGLVQIEDIQKGDFVSSFDFETEKIEQSVVLGVLNRSVEGYFVLDFGDSVFVEVTAEHPFYVESKGLVKVEDLSVGDKILSLNL